MSWALLKNMFIYQRPALASLLTDFKFNKQINAVVKAGFYHLRLLSKVKLFLSDKTFEQVMHAFISTRLDYCNALYTGVNQNALYRLQ